MKTFRYVRLLAIASVGLTPFAVYSANDVRTQACIDAFVTQNFPGQVPAIKVERDSSINSVLAYSVPFSLKLTATNRSGTLLASATCKSKEGVVTVVSDPAALIAVR